MSKRLQVIMEDKEYQELAKIAKGEGLSLGEWVRRALRSAAATVSARPPSKKLGSVELAMLHSFPTGDIDQMLAEIEQGYTNNSTD